MFYGRVSMLPLLLLLALGAPGPRAPKDAEAALHVPRLDRLSTLMPFLSRAGQRSVFLRPSTWREDFHPLLSVDLSRPEEVQGAGLAADGPVTVSVRGDFAFTCVQLADPIAYERKCLERLATLGKHFREEKDGAVLVGARDAVGRVLGGYAIKGKESCAVRGRGRSVEPLLVEAAKLLGKQATGLPFKQLDAFGGVAGAVVPNGVVSVRGAERSVTLDGRGSGAPTRGLAGGGPSPFALAAPDGLLALRVRGERDQLGPAASSVARAAADACGACDRGTVEEAAQALLPHLGGNALAFVDRVQVRGSLRTQAGRFFAMRAALLADVKDADGARAALAPLAKLRVAKPLDGGEGYALQLREGEVRIGVRQGFFYLSNDPAALEAALRASANGAGKQAHGAELQVDPRRLARALSQVSLLDAVASNELAGLVAVAGELGPLLLVSERIVGWLDPAGAQAARGQLTWVLLPLPQDGGREPAH